MKKRSFVIMLALAFFFFSAIIFVYPDSSGENIEKAGKELYNRHFEKLETLRKEIDNQIISICADGEATIQEMYDLKSKVAEYDSYRESANQDLEVYKLELADSLDPKLREALDVYFDWFKCGDNKQGTVRLFSAKSVGRDVRVRADLRCFGVMFLFVSWFFVFMGMMSFGEHGKLWGLILFVLGLGGFVLLFAL